MTRRARRHCGDVAHGDSDTSRRLRRRRSPSEAGAHLSGQRRSVRIDGVHRCRLQDREGECRRGASGVTGTLRGADVRGFYRALGVELPGWAEREAPVGCFADPSAHAHGDRDPSCSVNVESGAWHCWGCGAAGGAYDAALARGRPARDAIELMIAHGLAIRRAGRPERTRPPAAQPGDNRFPDRAPAARSRPALEVDECWMAEARARLASLVWPPRVLRPEQACVWSRAMVLELGCGWEQGRLIAPDPRRARRAARAFALRALARSGAEGVGGARDAAGADSPPVHGIVGVGGAGGGAAGHDQRPLAWAAGDRGAGR